MIIIWKALVEYLGNNLRAGKSVNIKRFGSFTFDIATELPRIATKAVSMTQTNNFDLEEQRLDRKHVHNVRPCFVVDSFLQPHLIHYPGKEEILPAKSQNSIYQKGFRMIYCNAVPIAAACLLGKEVVTDALNTIFLAIVDLIKYNRDLNLNFGFARISIINRGLKVSFANDYKSTCVDKTFEN
jgi:nucleoid DNA-binding protein